MNLKTFIASNIEIELDAISDSELIRDIQFHLNRIGYPLTVDGIIGEKTLAGWARFKKDNYLAEPEKIGFSSAQILLKTPTIAIGYFMPTGGVGWISSPFGSRGSGFHRGIDIAANEGTPVHAVEYGTVSTAVSGCHVGNWKCGGGYGNVVYIEHKRLPFSQTRYAHLVRLAAGIEVGRDVSKGTVIGYVGNTGHSFGNHLHFETRVNGTAKNPLTFINPIV